MTGIKAETVDYLQNPGIFKEEVTEIALGMAGRLNSAQLRMVAKHYFICAIRVTNRFQARRLAIEALRDSNWSGYMKVRQSGFKSFYTGSLG